MYYIHFRKLTMAEKQQTAYLSPVIPQTPSRKINQMLEQRCGSGFNKLPKALLGYYVCAIFTAINTVYKKIHRNAKRESFTHWGASCLIVFVLLSLSVYVLLNVAHGGAYVFAGILSCIGSIILSIVSVCSCVTLSVLKFTGIAFSIITLAVAAMAFAFFDKDGVKTD